MNLKVLVSVEVEVLVIVGQITGTLAVLCEDV